MSTTVYYPTDLTDEPWTLLQAPWPARKGRPGGPGRPLCALRAVLNGLLSLNQSGCQWRMIPQEFGHWKTL